MINRLLNIRCKLWNKSNALSNIVVILKSLQMTGMAYTPGFCYKIHKLVINIIFI